MKYIKNGLAATTLLTGLLISQQAQAQCNNPSLSGGLGYRGDSNYEEEDSGYRPVYSTRLNQRCVNYPGRNYLEEGQLLTIGTHGVVVGKNHKPINISKKTLRIGHQICTTFKTIFVENYSAEEKEEPLKGLDNLTHFLTDHLGYKVYVKPEQKHPVESQDNLKELVNSIKSDANEHAKYEEASETVGGLGYRCGSSVPTVIARLSIYRRDIADKQSPVYSAEEQVIFESDTRTREKVYEMDSLLDSLSPDKHGKKEHEEAVKKLTELVPPSCAKIKLRSSICKIVN